jgi:hypothetical protein
MTLIEVIVVATVLALLVAMILPALTAAKRRGGPSCMNNLKQIGLAYKIWAGDNGDKYPMQVSITNGGAMELAIMGNAVAVFQVMSNELSVPKILICPQDQIRLPAATNFSDSQLKSKISYFIGLDATETKSQMILSGDDNFAIDGVPARSGLVQFSTNSNIAWTSGRHVPYKAHFWSPTSHKYYGNIGLADGSVQSITSDGLPPILASSAFTNRLVIP